jgi:hypothetical protein
MIVSDQVAHQRTENIFVDCYLIFHDYIDKHYSNGSLIALAPLLVQNGLCSRRQE